MAVSTEGEAVERAPVVMVVEPNVLIRAEIADFLRNCGYRVIEGTVAGDVWTVIDAQITLDIVLSEVHLAGESDGFALARRLRQTRPDIDIILTSGVTGTAEKCRELCEEGPMKQPYRAEEVAARINLLLERRRSAAKKPG